MNEAAIIVSTISIVLSILGMLLGLISLALITGLKNSTHSIQYVPLDTVSIEEEDDEQKIKLTTKRKDPNIEDLYQHL